MADGSRFREVFAIARGNYKACQTGLRSVTAQRAMGTGLLALLLLAASVSAVYILHLAENEVCADGRNRWTCRLKNDCLGAGTGLIEFWKVCSYTRAGKALLCCPGMLSAGQLAWSGSWDKPPSGGWSLHKRPSVRPATPPPSSTAPSPPADRPPDKPLAHVMFVNFPQEAHPAGSPAAKAQEMCRLYSQYIYMEDAPRSPGTGPKFVSRCGLYTDPVLVFGGEDSRPHEFPYMARIGYGDEKHVEYGCGGSLVSERYVLSAAHCASVSGREAAWANLGDYDVTTDSDVLEEAVVTVRIVERIVHPDYDGDKDWYNDIALFRLEKDLKLGTYVRPACLNTKRDREEKYLLVSGWGLTTSNVENALPTILQKAELKVIPTEECNRTHNTLSQKDRAHYQRGILPQSQLCAGGVPGIAICGGDSGGPLQAVIPPCLFEVVGVTSFGVGCKSRYPGVYTNVVDYLPWIVKIFWG